MLTKGKGKGGWGGREGFAKGGNSITVTSVVTGFIVRAPWQRQGKCWAFGVLRCLLLPVALPGLVVKRTRWDALNIIEIELHFQRNSYVSLYKS